MFELLSDSVNRKIFNLKGCYNPEETFNYKLKVYNHISKSGFETIITDISPWVSGITNQSTLEIGEKNIFNNDVSNYISAIDDETFIFNNIIQISGVNYTFYPSENINFTQSVKHNDQYIVVFNDDSGQFAVINQDGTSDYYQFNSYPVRNISIISINNSIIIGYYDEVLGKSYLKEINIGSSTQYNSVLYYNGEVNDLKINKISDISFIITYQTDDKGIIQLVKLSNDHIFSIGYPFIFNDDITLFSNSVYQNGNVVVLFYDIDEQLKVKNCRIYDDYIGVGLPKIIKDNYCYDLNINKLDNGYVYCAYYDAESLKIELNILRISNDITIIEQEDNIDDWTEGLTLTTLNDKQYIISYMDSDYNGVFRYVDLQRVLSNTIYSDYNEFHINLNEVDTSKNIGHNDYWIYYNNEIIEKGVCKIK